MSTQTQSASPDNASIIQAIYAAFGRGDVPFILERVAPDTRWDFSVVPDEVPWHRPVAAREEVGRFLGDFVGHVRLEAFEPLQMVALGDDVIVRIHLAYVVARTGRRVDEEQVHWWRLADGRVTQLRHYEDTAQVQRAWAGA